jgi:hypothetical protein
MCHRTSESYTLSGTFICGQVQQQKPGCLADLFFVYKLHLQSFIQDLVTLAGGQADLLPNFYHRTSARGSVDM